MGFVRAVVPRMPSRRCRGKATNAARSATWWIDSASSSGGLTLRASLRSVHVRSPGRSHCDLQQFFDTVDHRKLLERLRESVNDRRLLGLIAKFLKAGVILPGGAFEVTTQGVPQGGPLSPLLANVLLDELDRELEARGHSFVRYADDFVILCASPRAGRRILESVRRFLHQRLKLIVNETKSKVVELSEAAFVGFQILRGRVRWSGKSRRRFKATVKRLTGRTRGVSARQVIEELALYTRGALNYYMIGVNFAEVHPGSTWRIGTAVLRIRMAGGVGGGG